MAYVINGGDKPSAKFHHFVDLCCQAFNVVRKHGNLILHLFGLVSTIKFYIIIIYKLLSYVHERKGTIFLTFIYSLYYI